MPGISNLLRQLGSSSAVIQGQREVMIVNNIFSYFIFTLIIFISIINVSHAGVSASAGGGAMSVLRGKMGFGPRPRDEEMEDIIMWSLVGFGGVALVLVACASCHKRKNKDPEDPRAKLYKNKNHEASLKCNLGKQQAEKITKYDVTDYQLV